MPLPISIKLQAQALAPHQDSDDLQRTLTAIVQGLQLLASKLDADAANTALNDTNYRALLDAIVTL